MFAVGVAEEEQPDPCRIRGPTPKLLDRPEIQDGQRRKGGRGYLISGSRMGFFSPDMCPFFFSLLFHKSHIFPYVLSEAGSEPQVPNPASLNSNAISVASKYL